MVARWAWPVAYIGVFCLFSWHLGGDGSPDTRIYHFYNGYAAVTGGRPQDLAPAGLQTFFHPGVDALYYRLFTSLNTHPVVLELLLGLPYAAVAWLVFRIGVALLPPGWPGGEAFAGAFALFGVTGAASLPTLGTMMTDVVPAVPIFAALAIWLRRGNDPAWLVGVGALAGISIGAKLTLLPVCVGFVATVTIVEARRPKRALLAGFAFGAAAVIAVLVIAGPWWLSNWQKYGNPILPAYNDLFRSEWVAAGRWTDDRFKPHRLWSILVYPSVWAFAESHDAVELNMHDPRMLMALIAVVALLVRRKAEPTARRLALLFLLAYVVWEIAFSIYRYLAVLECLSGVMVLAAMAAWGRRSMAPFAGLAALALTGAAAIDAKYPWWDRTRPGPLALQVGMPAVTDNALIMLLDPAAYSYAIPFLPPGVTVVGANTNLARPGSEGRLEAEIETRIKGWAGPIWGFENPSSQPGAADRLLAYYRLQRDTPCVEIDGNIGEPHTKLCRLKRSPAG